MILSDVHKRLLATPTTLPRKRGIVEMETSDSQPQPQPQPHDFHYTQMEVQPWEVQEAILTHEQFIGYLMGNIIKYAMRQGRKPSSPEDGAKCRAYIEKLQDTDPYRG